MGQLFCIPSESRSPSPTYCYYDLPRVQPISDNQFEERTIGNYYAIPRIGSINGRRLSIREPDKEVAIYIPNWRNSITNYKPFIIQNDLKTTP